MDNLLIIGIAVVFLVIVIIAVILILWVIRTYNMLISYRELVRNAMAQIGAQIESRWDALSNLIEATKEYAEFESNTLVEVVKQRKQITQMSTVDDVEKDTASFSSAFSRLLAVAENYPDLKTSQVYINTMDSVNSYESNVRIARMSYNDTVTKLNREIQMFPTNIVAKIFGFNQEKYFESTDTKKEMPKWN
ncbi:MAG: LemA family protein [Methanosarcinaceae archaeon]|nr:LemA family protein [Methanosarcinaceae archaeon]